MGAAIISACYFSSMVNPPVSVLIRGCIFGFWHRISLSPVTFSTNHSYSFQFPLDDFPIFGHLALSSFGELFSSFHCHLFRCYFSWCYRLHFRFSVSSPVVVWIAEQFRHLYGSDVLVSFRERLVLCPVLLGQYISTCYHWCLAGYVTSHLVHSCVDQQRILFRLSRFTCVCISFWVGTTISFCMTSSRDYDRTVSLFLRISEHWLFWCLFASSQEYSWPGFYGCSFYFL